MNKKIKSNPSKGFITVASNLKSFYSLACNLAESILDYMPDAKITLVTEEKFVDSRADLFDKIIYCDDHIRAKMWGMLQSPYDITAYLDADMEIVHEDIANIFDEIEETQSDIMFTGLLPENYYAYAQVYFDEQNKDDFYKLKLNGGLCVYDLRQPKVKEFLETWYELFKKQYAGEWWPDINEDGSHSYKLYDQGLRRWDQFTLWYLTNIDSIKDEIKLTVFDDSNRWNWYSTLTTHRGSTHKDPIVIFHYSSMAPKTNDI
jgi:hypothetical protein